MKNILRQIILGKDNKASGLIALGIVGLFVLGCNCGKLSELGGKKDPTPPSNPSNTFTPTNTGTAPKKDPTFTKSDASKKQIPSDPEMQEIVKATLLDFNEALQAQDFTTFHGKVSRVWQKQTSPEKMKQTFQGFIDGKANLSNISSLDATFTTPGNIQKKLGFDMLDVKGEYPTSPIKTTFELQYVPEGKDWKLALIKVYAAIKK